ncbi:kinase-like domain-containing protein [Syncephalis plumigaleata]|nr:kinase-like domain-containing protein [Syncephalis plumigaleata]
MRFTTFTVAGIIHVLVLAACVHQVLASPKHFRPAKPNSDKWKLITLPVDKPDALAKGLTVKKTIGYGDYSVMGYAHYNGDEAFVKCSYASNSIKKEKTAYESIVKFRSENPNVKGSQYFVKLVHSFTMGLPYKVSSFVKKFITTKWPKSLSFTPGQCIITEYAGKQTLDTYLEHLTTRRYPIIYKLIYQLLEALQYLHKAGIAYNDLKPTDVVISLDESNNPILKLIDFDRSLTFDATKTDAPEGKVRGLTFNYVAPEILSFSNYNLLTADTWAVGAIFYHLLTGWTVFEALQGRYTSDYQRNKFKLLRDYQSGKLPISPATRGPRNNEFIPHYLTILLSRLLIINPKARYPPETFLQLNRYNPAYAA